MGLNTFGDFFMAAQALSVRGDQHDSDTDGKQKWGRVQTQGKPI